MCVLSRCRALRRPWLVVTVDELALGVRVCLAVVAVARGERALQRQVFRRQRGVCAQAVTEPKAPVELLSGVHEVEVMSAVRRGGVAEEASMRERGVEGWWVLVARVGNQGGDRRIEIGHKRDHVDHRLGRKAGHGGGAEVVDVGPVEQGCEPVALGLESRRPAGVVVADLHLGITPAGPGEVFGCCGLRLA